MFKEFSDVFAGTLTGILNEFHPRVTKQELITKGSLEGGDFYQIVIELMF